MAINLIVLAVTLLMGVYIVVWVFFPRLRARMEEPKHRFLERQRGFGRVFREPGKMERVSELPPE